MATAKLFQHGGSQAVRLPKMFRFEGSEVLIERRGEEVVLRPKPRLATFGALVAHLRNRFPDGTDFPAVERLRDHERPDLGLG
jgi:antitoxin VapB